MRACLVICGSLTRPSIAENAKVCNAYEGKRFTATARAIRLWGRVQDAIAAFSGVAGSVITQNTDKKEALKINLTVNGGDLWERSSDAKNKDPTVF